MKTLPNILFTIKADELRDTRCATTSSLIKLTLSQQPDPTPDNPRGGFTFTTMRERNKIADAVEKAKIGGKIELEDSLFAVARKCVEDFRWGRNHPDILKFGELFGL